MKLEQHQYYHLYNRTNNKERLFKETGNCLYFLRKFRGRFHGELTVFAYCLMPTHFHFLIRIDTARINNLRKQIGIYLSAYTKAINSAYDRHGSLFQEHTKAKHIDDESYLITLLTYIHQNPIRSGLVKRLEDWHYSSYPDLAGLRNGTLVDKTLIRSYFKSTEDFRIFSNQTIENIKKEYWIE